MMRIKDTTAAAIERAILPVLLINVVFSVWFNWSAFGGDPEIHIIFASNLLDGFPLQFNKGEFTSGETSPIYMLIVAGLKLLCGVYVPLAMKLLGAASLLGICFLTWRAARDTPPRVALILGCSILWLPSMYYQVSLGMENTLFAFLLLASVHYVLGSERPSIARNVFYATGLPILFFLRPEAVLFIAAASVIELYRKDMRALGGIAAGVALTGLIYFGIQFYTGVNLQAAGVARAALSRFDSRGIEIGGHMIAFSLKPGVAVAYLAPFAAILAWNWRLLRPAFPLTVVFVFLVLAPLALHILNIFPNTHFSRYFIYGYAVFFYVFARLFGTLWQPAAYGLAVLVLGVTLIPYENLSRSGLERGDVRETIRGLDPKFVKEFSDSMIARLKPARLPAVVAMQEVQMRMILDDRFVVRSLDGIVDAQLLKSIKDGWVDHFQYIEDRQIEFIMGPANYNRDKSKPSLADIMKQPHTKIGNLCFDRVEASGQNNDYRVSHC